MTSAPLEESLSFDISGALQGIGQIDDALQQVVQSFAVGLSSALETLTGAGQDVTPLAESLDVAGLGPAVDAALAEAETTVPVDADTSALTSDIDAATDVTATVPVDADVSGAQAEIGGLEGETVVVPVEVDTAGAEADIQAVGEAAGGASGKVLDLGAATGGFNAAAAIGRGEAAGLGAGVGLLGPQALAVAGGFTAAAGTIGLFFNNALDAQAAVLRLDQSMGPLAERIENLQVGDLNADLSELALSLGSDDDALRNIAATLFNFQTGAGTADLEASKFSETVLALSARAVAANPALGSMEQVAGRLGNVLGRGGRFASQFGIDLSSVDIKARAAENAANGLGDGVSFASLQLAGGQLALEKYGDVLTEEIEEGTKNPIIQLAALRTKFEEAAEEIGQPLVAPIFDLLTDLEPVAESVARVMGSLAQVVLPALTVLASGLGLLEPPLSLLSDGLGFIADLGTPATVAIVGLGVAAGLAQLPFFGLTAAAAAFGTALTIATGPIGIVVAGLAAVGIASRLAADGAAQAAVDTTALKVSFDGTGDSADQFSENMGAANEAIDAYLEKQLTLGDDTETQAEVVSRLGLSFDDLKTALTGTDTQFDTILGRLVDTTSGTDDVDSATNQLIDTLAFGRQQLLDNAEAAVLFAEANGLISSEQLKAAEANNVAAISLDGYGKSTIDYMAVQRELTPLIRAAKQEMIDQGLATGRLQQAFLDLRPAIADGSLTAEDAEQVALDLGISLDDATAAVDSLSAAMDAFVSGGLAALPDAGSAIEEFASGISSAQSSLDAALDAAANADDGSLDGVVQAQESANRQIADNAEQTTRTITDAQRKVDDARGKLATAERQAGEGQAAAVKNAQGQLQTALDGLTSAREKAGESHADAVRDASQKVSDAQDAANEATGEQAQKAKEAQDAYLRAIDPQRVIEAEFANAFAIGAFQANVAKLIEANRLNVAALAISEGPEKAGQLVNALVNDDVKAKALDAGIAVANNVTSGYGRFLEENKAALSGRLITLADGTVVDATDSFSAAGGSLASTLITGLTTPLNVKGTASEQVKDAVRRLAEGGAAAFDPNLAAPSKDAASQAGVDAQAGFKEGFDPAGTATVQVGKIPAAITSSIQPAVTASGIAGTGLTDEFADHLHFAGAVTANLNTIPERFTRDDVLLTAAGFAGVTLGLAFGEGFAAGIEARGPDVSDAAGALASKADDAVRRRLGIDSPSKAGIDIGEQYVAGIAQGLGALSPVERATAALTLALVPDLRPVLRQTPQLASGIVAASPATVGVGASLNPTPDASAPRLVEAQITLNKTDPDPKHFADELAWMLQ